MSKAPPDYAEKARRRAVPATRVAWQRELDGITAFAAQKPHHLSTNGQHWFDSMCRYNLARVDVLLSTPPSGLSPGQARKLVAGVKKLLG